MSATYPRVMTAVFRFETPESFAPEWERLTPLLWADEGPKRVTGISMRNEMQFARLIEEARDHYDDAYAFKEVVDDLCRCPDLSKWVWP